MGGGILEGENFSGCWVASLGASGPTKVRVVLTECPACCWFSRKYQETGSSFWQNCQGSTTAEWEGGSGRRAPSGNLAWYAVFD